TSKTWERRSRC
ncbi:hypothetical protein CFOL_v3_12497, partial [Cephalotus follicularis]